jgi:hypothetical protein
VARGDAERILGCLRLATYLRTFSPSVHGL